MERWQGKDERIARHHGFCSLNIMRILGTFSIKHGDCTNWKLNIGQSRLLMVEWLSRSLFVYVPCPLHIFAILLWQGLEPNIDSHRIYVIYPFCFSYWRQQYHGTARFQKDGQFIDATGAAANRRGLVGVRNQRPADERSWKGMWWLWIRLSMITFTHCWL